MISFYNRNPIEGSDCKVKYKNRPLVQKLVEFKEAVPVSFHVPGHKNGLLSGLPSQLRSALTYDFTELTGLDDLHQPEGVIEEAEQKLASLYQADKSFFLVNGSTVGNLAMIYATCREGETVIVQRNAHKSIFNAIELTGARPVLVTPEWDPKTKTAGTMTTKQVRKALAAYPEAKAVVLTYPTYYGTIGENLEETIEVCHERHIPVLVDEAHGAHFVIGNPFPQSALMLGADVVVHSAHKTLPAMTMASFLHVKSKLISTERIAHYLQMLQSSSPSYLLMASLDDARAYAETFMREDTIGFLENRGKIINRLAKIPLLQLIEPDDPLKLIVRTGGYSGFELQKALEIEGVYAELADPYQVLFVLPLIKQGQPYMFEEIAKKIEYAVRSLQGKQKKMFSVDFSVAVEDLSEPCYTVRELEQFQAGWVNYGRTVGMIAAASIIPYPPGIPLLLAGERVTEAHIQSLSGLLEMDANFQGAIRVSEKQIFVVIDEVEE